MYNRHSMISRIDGMNKSKELRHFAKQLREVWIMCESQRQMHRLAHQYFKMRHFWFGALPISVITMVSGIMAFLSTSQITAACQKEYLSLSVGVVAVLSSFVQSLAQEAQFGSRAEMHQNAALGMKKLADEIGFKQVDLCNDKKKAVEGKELQKTDSDREEGDEEQITDINQSAIERSSVEKYYEVYQQCLNSCNSTVPVAISQSFHLAESRLALGLSREDRIVIRNELGYLGRQKIMNSVYNELFCHISQSSCWPLGIPNPDEAVDTVLKKVQKSFHCHTPMFSRSRGKSGELVIS
jgi:hypothetical protein